MQEKFDDSEKLDQGRERTEDADRILNLVDLNQLDWKSLPKFTSKGADQLPPVELTELKGIDVPKLTDELGRVEKLNGIELRYADKSMTNLSSIKLPTGERYEIRDGMVFSIDKAGRVSEKLTGVGGKIVATETGFEIVQRNGKRVADIGVSALQDSLEWKIQHLKDKFGTPEPGAEVSKVNGDQRVVQHGSASFTYDANNPSRLKSVSIKEQNGDITTHEVKAGGVVVLLKNGKPVRDETGVNSSIQSTQSGVRIVDGKGKVMIDLSIGDLQKDLSWQVQRLKDSRRATSRSN